MGLVSEKKIFNFQFLVVYLVVYYLTKMGKSVNPDCPGSKQTVVLEDSVVGGDINLPGDLCLFGKILGNITAGGRVEVRQGALVTGHVRCRELYVEGAVEGNVETRSLIIGENAALKGKVETGKLRVEGEIYEIKWLRLVRK